VYQKWIGNVRRTLYIDTAFPYKDTVQYRISDSQIAHLDPGLNPSVPVSFALLVSPAQPTQKGGVNAPFLSCTSEVTQWFLYIYATLLHKINEFGVKGESGGWIFAISLPERWHGCRMRVLVRISPILLFSDRFRVKPYPIKQRKRGVKICP
jgi:hypothetical protein